MIWTSTLRSARVVADIGVPNLMFGNNSEADGEATNKSGIGGGEGLGHYSRCQGHRIIGHNSGGRCQVGNYSGDSGVRWVKGYTSNPSRPQDGQR